MPKIDLGKVVGADGKNAVFVRNLLDNSDFRNPVNQRVQTSYSTVGYTVDRWRIWLDTDTVEIKDGYISVSGNGLHQYIESKNFNNAIYTIAAKKTDGTIVTYSQNANDAISANNNLGFGYESAIRTNVVRLPAGEYVWAALYEGEYTAETLPPYVPKGYAVELAECMKYFERLSCKGVFSKQNYPEEFVRAPTNYALKRIKPTIEVITLWSPGYYSMEQMGTIGFREIQSSSVSISVSTITAEGRLFEAILHISADL